jgi:hypothetical protein
MTNHRTGLLVIRAWVEEGSTEPLRAQIRVTGDVSTGIERSLTLVQSDTVSELVDTWLHGMLHPSAP